MVTHGGSVTQRATDSTTGIGRTSNWGNIHKKQKLLSIKHAEQVSLSFTFRNAESNFMFTQSWEKSII
jgi:hypothetical protein